MSYSLEAVFKTRTSNSLKGLSKGEIEIKINANKPKIVIVARIIVAVVATVSPVIGCAALDDSDTHACITRL
ncbi:7191_t:CDS:2 [Entrophospora sp. SA101]|nr:7191_t:CDS:2 [Entrophospora sp. SA101]